MGALRKVGKSHRSAIGVLFCLFEPLKYPSQLPTALMMSVNSHCGVSKPGLMLSWTVLPYRLGSDPMASKTSDIHDQSSLGRVHGEEPGSQAVHWETADRRDGRGTMGPQFDPRHRIGRRCGAGAFRSKLA